MSRWAYSQMKTFAIPQGCGRSLWPPALVPDPQSSYPFYLVPVPTPSLSFQPWSLTPSPSYPPSPHPHPHPHLSPTPRPCPPPPHPWPQLVPDPPALVSPSPRPCPPSPHPCPPPLILSPSPVSGALRGCLAGLGVGSMSVKSAADAGGQCAFKNLPSCTSSCCRSLVSEGAHADCIIFLTCRLHSLKIWGIYGWTDIKMNLVMR